MNKLQIFIHTMVNGSTIHEYQINGYYVFNNLSESFTTPISIRLNKTYKDDEISITAQNIITRLEPNDKFHFESNFCIDSENNNAKIETLFTEAIVIVTVIFIFIAILSLICSNSFCIDANI